MDYLEIKEHSGEGYLPLVCFEEWKIALIRYAHRFDEKNFRQMERHLLTDEVFILLCGRATLVIGGNQNAAEHVSYHEMEKQKLYNVKKNVWHHIFLSKNACVCVVENFNTGEKNTSYYETKERK